MRIVTRQQLAGAIVTAAALTASVLSAAPVLASTVMEPSARMPARVLANSCGLPTSARPNSSFIESFYYCDDCKKTAAYDQKTLGGTFYCTYNPRNGLTDEHRQY
ncbi:hypothetical protein SAMN05216276_11457 [Streptosporangium subroseum]|uniref:Uncharacterized protein n=1 Tax=Streptosporangium subroseum TaxID=106412 RepID=A0A239PCW2_9ACTN|nr:hypothetical protein [Streptosporangium subroseum]SNT64911.1 hypothetical protein SAMN05216276_11457 [Streptosporangium subroseum]